MVLWVKGGLVAVLPTVAKKWLNLTSVSIQDKLSAELLHWILGEQTLGGSRSYLVRLPGNLLSRVLVVANVG